MPSDNLELRVTVKCYMVINFMLNLLLVVMNNGTGIERIAEWCYEVGKEYIEMMTDFRCWVKQVEVWEHENNSVIISREVNTLSSKV